MTRIAWALLGALVMFAALAPGVAGLIGASGPPRSGDGFPLWTILVPVAAGIVGFALIKRRGRRSPASRAG
jgi:hypothetical protein